MYGKCTEKSECENGNEWEVNSGIQATWVGLEQAEKIMNDKIA